MKSKNKKRTTRIAILVAVSMLVVVAIAGVVFAATPGVLTTFQEERLADAKARLDSRVADGTLDQAAADSLYAGMQTRIESCTAAQDGTGNSAGRAFRGGRNGMGRGLGNGSGTGVRAGCGGICTATITPAA